MTRGISIEQMKERMCKNVWKAKRTAGDALNCHGPNACLLCKSIDAFNTNFPWCMLGFLAFNRTVERERERGEQACSKGPPQSGFNTGNGCSERCLFLLVHIIVETVQYITKSDTEKNNMFNFDLSILLTKGRKNKQIIIVVWLQSRNL